MKKCFWILFLFLFVGFQVHAQSEQALVNLSSKKFEWMIRMQYDSLESVLDDRLMFVHSNGWTETKQELIQDIKSGKLRYTNVEVQESNARMYKYMAVVTGKGKFNVELDGKPLEIILSYTEVYVQKKKKWLLASRHANRMP